ARAQVLAALDTAPRWYRGWWRPAAIVLAMAGIAFVAVVAVRHYTPAQRPVIADFMKPPAPVAVEQDSRQAMQPRSPAPLKPRELPPPPAPALNPPVAAEPAVIAALRKDEAAPPLPPPPAQQSAPAP